MLLQEAGYTNASDFDQRRDRCFLLTTGRSPYKSLLEACRSPKQGRVSSWKSPPAEDSVGAVESVCIITSRLRRQLGCVCIDDETGRRTGGAC